MATNKRTPADATTDIRALAATLHFNLYFTHHALTQMEERNLLTGDALNVLKKGFVLDDPEPSTQDGFWKYKMIGTSPNSHNREVAVIIIPDFDNHEAKVVTVFWVDE